ncbi:STAS-like domain-containing protein [Streptomyces mirabilis]|uniref:STAS-like domain-containing protein n=1 Tax=Streptomyces mirabilis TaxID=68239 RepID=UPI00371A2D02
MSYINDGAPYLILDFEGVPMVSSSFADETIGKLAERFGPVGFAQRFRLINMNPSVQMLLDRAIASGSQLSSTGMTKFLSGNEGRPVTRRSGRIKR